MRTVSGACSRTWREIARHSWWHPHVGNHERERPGLAQQAQAFGAADRAFDLELFAKRALDCISTFGSSSTNSTRSLMPRSLTRRLLAVDGIEGSQPLR